MRLASSRSGCEFVDYAGLCGVGFVGGRRTGGLWSLHRHVQRVSDACAADCWRCGSPGGDHCSGFEELDGLFPVKLTVPSIQGITRLSSFEIQDLLRRRLLLAQFLELIVDLLRRFDTVG